MHRKGMIVVIDFANIFLAKVKVLQMSHLSYIFNIEDTKI
jgi:hypothetical protein